MLNYKEASSLIAVCAQNINGQYKQDMLKKWKTQVVLETANLLAEGHSLLGIYKVIEPFFKFTMTTLSNWIKSFEKHGALGLYDNRGGERNTKILTDLVEEAILGTVARNFKTAFKNYINKAKSLNKFVQITYQTFLRNAKSLFAEKPALKIFWERGGDKVLADLVPTHSEKAFGTIRKKIKSGKWRVEDTGTWQIDGTKLDIMVVKNGKIVRPFAVALIDRFSGRATIQLSESENSYAHAELLDKAFAEHGGAPYVIKGDNGKSFVSKHFQAILQRSNIEYIASRPFHGEDKGKIERFFGVLQTRAEFQTLKGYVGNSVSSRQVIESKQALKSEKLSGVATHWDSKKLLNWEEFEMILNKMVSDRNSKLPENDYLQRVDNMEEILGKRELRVVSKEGVRFGNDYFWSIQLANLIGKTVLVTENIFDISEIFVTELNAKSLKALNENINLSARKMRMLGTSTFVVKNAERIETTTSEWRSIQKEATKPHRQMISLARKLGDEFAELNLKQYQDLKKDKIKEAMKKPEHQRDYSSVASANVDPEILKLQKEFEAQELQDLYSIM